MQGKPQNNLAFPAKQQSFSIGKAVFAGKRPEYSPEYPLEQVIQENRLSHRTPVRLADTASQLFTLYQDLIRPR